MDEESRDLMLALSLQDAQYLHEEDEDKRRERQALQDQDFAVEVFREELRREARALADQRLAKMTAEADDDEADGQPKSPIPSATPIYDSIAERSAPSSGSRSQKDKILSDLEKRVVFRDCVVCQETVASEELMRAECDDHYCKKCVNELFRYATTDESLFPPRCCGQEILISSAEPFLDPEIFQTFERKAIEYKTINRTYCYDTSCGGFISPENIMGEKATCEQCGKNTCTVCKSSAHKNDCPKDPAYESFMQFLEDSGFQRCCNCKRPVELNFGCNHMTCICRSEFCYKCGVKWKECDCDLWDENRLLARAEVVVDRDLGNFDPAYAEFIARENRFLEGDAALRARNALIREGARRLRARDGCRHPQWQKVKQHNLQCEECFAILPTYLLECRVCQLRACARCKRHRI